MRKYTLLVLAVALFFAVGMMAQTSSSTTSQSSDQSGMQSGSSQSGQTGNTGSEEGNPTNRQPGMGSAPQNPTGGYGGQPATGAPSSQTGTYGAQTSSGSNSGQGKNIQGCVVRTATDYYIYPAKGKPEHISSSGQDVSTEVGHQVKLHGTEQPSTSASNSGTSGGTSGMAGNTSSNNAESNTGSAGSMSSNTSGAGSSAAGNGKDLIVDRVSVISTNCPASITGNAQAAGMSTSPNK